MSLKLLILLSVPLLTWATCPSESIYDSTFNKCYKYQTDLLSFFLAEQNCVAMGGDLVSLSNGFENALVLENAKQHFGTAAQYWIGANQLASINWTWTDKTPFVYTNWNANEPNASHQCGAVRLDTGFWESDACGGAKPYVCAVPQVPTPASCPTSAPIAYCDSGWTIFNKNNQCYKVLQHENNNVAQETCKALGANLASIHSAEENEFITDIASCGLTLDSNDMTWIGMYKTTSGTWANYDGTTVDYYNWAPGEPNDSGGKEKCVELYSDEVSKKRDHRTRWNDCDCTLTLRAYVCKKAAYIG